MIQLYDHYNQASQDLHYSLTQSGISGAVVVINEDGFLPSGVTSPYAYFCQMVSGDGTALYFNQISVPDFWEIRGTNSGGEVWEYSHLRAKIFYAHPSHLRLVKMIDWYDSQGQVKLTEHYNQYGWLFARTYFTNQQKPSVKTYYNQNGQEIIVENFLTGDIILNWQGQTLFFANRVEFIRYYIELMDWSLDRIVYNSLSTPFFFSYRLEQPGQDILFWQEPIGDDLPGNMKILLGNKTTRTQKIVVQDRQNYDKMLGLMTEEDRERVTYLGFIYPEKSPVKFGNQILIVTNSDQIEGLETLTDQLTDYQFHIAALTEMSDKLTNFDQKSNVHLYPNCTESRLVNLFEACQFYLDINRGNEVFSANRRAFEHNLLILGFEETRHQQQFGLAEHFLPVAQQDQLVELIRNRTADFSQAIAKQREHQAGPSSYQQLFS